MASMPGKSGDVPPVFWVLSRDGVRFFRAAVGLAGFAVGLVLLVSNAKETALTVSLLAFGAFVMAHLSIDIVWDHVTGLDAGANPGDTPPSPAARAKIAKNGGAPTPTKGPDQSIRDITVQLSIALITTAGVVLGLIQAFAPSPLNLTAKVGTLSLAGDVVVGFVLLGLCADSTQLNDRAWHFRAYVFNIVLWALAFGLLCIAFSFVYRTH